MPSQLLVCSKSFRLELSPVKRILECFIDDAMAVTITIQYMSMTLQIELTSHLNQNLDTVGAHNHSIYMLQRKLHRWRLTIMFHSQGNYIDD